MPFHLLSLALFSPVLLTSSLLTFGLLRTVFSFSRIFLSYYRLSVVCVLLRGFRLGFFVAGGLLRLPLSFSALLCGRFFFSFFQLSILCGCPLPLFSVSSFTFPALAGRPVSALWLSLVLFLQSFYVLALFPFLRSFASRFSILPLCVCPFVRLTAAAWYSSVRVSSFSSSCPLLVTCLRSCGCCLPRCCPPLRASIEVFFCSLFSSFFHLLCASVRPFFRPLSPWSSSYSSFFVHRLFSPLDPSSLSRYAYFVRIFFPAAAARRAWSFPPPTSSAYLAVRPPPAWPSYALFL